MTRPKNVDSATAKRSGPRTPYWPKVRGSVAWTPLAWSIARAAAKRTKQSVSNVGEALLRRFGAELRRSDFE